MGIRLTGINSGMDTDSIVQALMSAQSYKKTKIEAKKTKLEWKKELWSELNTKIYNFYTNSLSKIKLQGTFKTKAATSSDSSKVTATATSSAAEGTYKINVKSLASAQYVTSGKLNGAQVRDENGNVVPGEKAKVSKSTKLIDLLDANGATSFTKGTQIKLSTESGRMTTLLVDENTSVSDFLTACNDVGLTASFDADQQRFFISSGASGKEQGFKISATALSQTQQDTISAWKNAIGYDYLSSADQKAVRGIFDSLQAGPTTYNDVKDTLQSYLDKSQRAGVTAYHQKQLTDSYNDYFDTDPSSGKRILSAKGKLALATSDPTLDLSNMSPEDQVAAAEAMVASKVATAMSDPAMQTTIESEITNGIPGTTDTFLAAGATARTTNLEAAVNNYVSAMSTVAGGAAGLSGLGLGEVDGTAVAENSNATGMVVVEASDSEITFNGATLTSSTSTLTVNGLTLNILDTTAGSDISISVTKDTSAIYDAVKDFISDYNDILKTMNSYYNAGTAKGYDVLTDEQKEAMTDDEIEKWEDKIKSSLLRRDDTLGAIISSFKMNMMGGYTASDGKQYSLASLGISTSAKNWYEGGLLHIKGDEDDAEYMDEENKLEAMLTKDPELTMEILNGLAGNLYTDLQKKMASTSMSSALTFYNDKEMNSQLSDYSKQITAWEKKLASLEERYYKQFTAMEKAMASLNSQQNYFSSMMG